MNIVICTIKTWNILNAKELIEKYQNKHSIHVISEKNEFNYENLCKLEPDYIFFPHWSYIIPSEIFTKWQCIVFHMTDLPYGRGGSPLQNLIVRGFDNTKISAIKVVQELDGGPIYLKEDLSLSGSAEDIFKRASSIIFNKMIPFILDKSPVPVEQSGEVVPFKRRTKEQSQINSDMTLKEIYDYIRMLDAEGYPNAYISYGKYKLKFTSADYDNMKIIAKVEIVEEIDE